MSKGIDVTEALGGHAILLERLLTDPREPEEIIACGDMKRWQIELGIVPTALETVKASAQKQSL